ncbi:outer membrane protein assembly factor BamD [Paraflavitalea sp. CAU 1676]|uniref:outer membrane protein assembly factor BamD n=1 Tax=Paraflavitalea sp. CAU 1676 TaxID=3032598 RepID=UPI0023DB0363|nr:outer membrane protein assembly factor BamD [Paraflavitalea sp. CAU 1676]MDF2189382.1 outer membrane protein assembly factor BamD [Paraflavitalea sp. CAU 1676]
MKSAFLIVFFALGLASCSKFAKVQKSNDYDYKLRMAEKYYVAKKYNYAKQLYEELFPLMKGQPQFEDLFYKFAYCSYYLHDWMNAENLFKQFVEVFPNSPKAEEMDYMRAYTYYRQSPKVALDQTTTEKTIGLMQTFINTHPGSTRIKEAGEIIDKCRLKLEAKELLSAELYYNMGKYRAAAIAYTSLMNGYPDSQKSDQYKFQIIKSYYLFASNSIDEKKPARFEQVVTECNDFADRFPDSKLIKDVERYSSLSQNNIKEISKVNNNEQVKTTN